MRLLLVLLLSVAAQASWRDALPGARMVGQGEMRWFGLKLYRAELLSHSGKYDPQQGHALVLTYARSFKADRIIDASLEQMARLGAPKARFDDWAAHMRRGFVDVSEGDALVGVLQPGKGIRFYAGERLTADIDDPEFARWFFAIWLDARTSEPGLRKQLLGGAP